MIDDAVTVAELRRRGSVKWTAPGPDGFGAGIAEMDFGTAPPILEALAAFTSGASFGYLPGPLEDELSAATAEWVGRRYGWTVEPSLVHALPDVLKGLELAITHFSRAGAPIILPTPAYMPFLLLPGLLGRPIIPVPMQDDAGCFTLDLDGIDAAFRAGGDLVVFCNPCNPVGRVFGVDEMRALTEVVDRNGGRVFADEIHAPLVYPGSRHVPYAATSETAAGHAITATSASKAWNLPGLKCAQLILSNERDRASWGVLGSFASHGASVPGVVANIAAYRHGEPWLGEVLDYLDGNRRLLASLLASQLPDVRYRPPDGTYLAWLDFASMSIPGSVGELITERAKVLVVPGPECGGSPASVRFNFATPRPVLTEMIERIAAAIGRF